MFHGFCHLMFDSLPIDVFNFFPLFDLLRLAAISTNLYNKIINDEEFWKSRFLIKKEDQRWIDAYISNYANVYICGHVIDKVVIREPTIIANHKFKDICIAEHIIAIDLHDNVWTWGDNEHGQLGLGDCKGRSTPTLLQKMKAKQIAVGYGCTALIDLDDNIWICGWNKYGKLRINTKETKTFIKDVGFKAKQIAFGIHHTIVLDLENNVKTYGYNKYGQLGLGDCEKHIFSKRIINFKIKQIAAGEHHSFLIDTDDNLWSFGSNDRGQLGLGHTEDVLLPVKVPEIKVKQIAAGCQHSILIDSDDNVWTCGNNDEGQLGLGEDIEYITTFVQLSGIKAKQISAGSSYIAIIDMNNNIWQCGNGFYGLQGWDNFGLKQVKDFKAVKVAAGVKSTAFITML